MNDRWRALLRPLGVTCVNAAAVRERHPVRTLNGWELKPYSVINSRFEEVLLLDADNVPCADPTYLFDAPEYASTGAVFWPDFGRLDGGRAIWEICGVEYRDEPEIESGQVLVDKRRCWEQLRMTMHLNEYSDFYYRHVHGDKETFHMAWRMARREYAMPRRPIEALPGTMCQHDFQDRRVFQHRNARKWQLVGANPETPGFYYEAECRRALADLWDRLTTAEFGAYDADQRRLYEWVTGQKRFRYNRVSHGSRVIELLPGYRIGEGGARLEQWWSIGRIRGRPCVQLLGEAGLLCDLVPDGNGVLGGRWAQFERMPVFLVPTLE